MGTVRKNLVAWLALFFALTGTGIAASRYVITSPAQIKPSVLRKLRGTQGSQGTQGTEGVPGPKGLAGSAGSQGREGSRGERGERGAEGPSGPEGPQGPRGWEGTRGETGPRGERGMVGEQGEKGESAAGFFTSARFSGFVPISKHSEPVRLHLPAGNYILHALAVVADMPSGKEGIPGSLVTCGLSSSIEPKLVAYQSAQATVTPGSIYGEGITQTLPLEAAYTASSEATIILGCGSQSPTGDEGELRYASLSAIAVQPLIVE